jgi:hypothetical protein
MIKQCQSSTRAVETGALTCDPRRDAVLAHPSGLWKQAEEQMDTRSRPPGCGAGPLGRMRACATAGGCVPVHHVVPSHLVDIKSPARPPARRRDWCCSGSSSCPSHRAHLVLQVSFPSQILRRLPRSKGKQVACAHAHTHSHTHTHTHTHMPLAHCE